MVGIRGLHYLEFPSMVDSLNPNNEFEEKLLLSILEKLNQPALNLPPLPHVANQVLLFSNDSEVNTNRLAALIQQDPILAGKIFQLANSAGAGASHPIESLQQAIAWLGLNAVALNAFFLSVQSGMFNVDGFEQEVKGLWKHALTTGLYGKCIAALIGNDENSAYLCGLLHAIGKPFVIHTVNQNRKCSESCLPWTTIMNIVNKSYVEVGRQLGEAWGLPFAVKEAISLHQDHSYHLTTSPTRGAVITCLARHLATHVLDQENMSEDALRAHLVIQALNLSQDQLTALLEKHDEIKEQVENLLR